MGEMEPEIGGRPLRGDAAVVAGLDCCLVALDFDVVGVGLVGSKLSGGIPGLLVSTVADLWR